jgi:dTDP-glucose 4,6-dehydratase
LEVEGGMKKLLVTGGAGFIGSNFVKKVLKEDNDTQLVVLDLLTYCGNLKNFTDEERHNPRFLFRRGDIRDRELVTSLMRDVDQVVHFAAETHIDRSIDNSDVFVSTDVMGTHVLLEAIRKHPVERFIHISTSEVYGTAQAIPMTENHPLDPNSPYAATKAGGDRLAYSFYYTYGLPVVILRPFNNYGPNQYPEKLIPLFITNALEDGSLPIYGDGKNTRDWLHVSDCCEAILLALQVDLDEVKGQAINVGTGKETDVLTIGTAILERLGKSQELMKMTKDRPGHVKRLCSSTEKAKSLLDFEPTIKFKDGLEDTVEWYRTNEAWWKEIKERKEYKEFCQRLYQFPQE